MTGEVGVLEELGREGGIVVEAVLEIRKESLGELLGIPIPEKM